MDKRTLQSIVSVAAILCIVVGWVNPFSPEINYIISRQVFYILVGGSFILMGGMLPNKKYSYLMYLAAGLCIVGAFLSMGSSFEVIKTVGLLLGVVISFVGRRG
ncbi:hypothetical protein [Riemerella anatipestifer]|uniref:Uncharacterized protein n=1 Tax=Riemerella anatipestifer TaxID=34085 RepID=A0A1S7DT92_RIEAN|nr:hypothetical protein [Riemerella anatipestifer]AQY22345.1 hypothetical protein AB406_1399 [Riemerella anatipestifer]MBT0552118.1 hypothetical protein [Riemerella anatipestifer]MBT0554401.1 hypothetical protein [Riemerella anatipestifer]MCE3025216.1 hypothetical protein [Riemerella anatipestifer]MCO4304834.1 hypothetical protein [Riemerella anatipestifer]